jgi:hypothetical protein
MACRSLLPRYLATSLPHYLTCLATPSPSHCLTTSRLTTQTIQLKVSDYLLASAPCKGTSVSTAAGRHKAWPRRAEAKRVLTCTPGGALVRAGGQARSVAWQARQGRAPARYSSCGGWGATLAGRCPLAPPLAARAVVGPRPRLSSGVAADQVPTPSALDDRRPNPVRLHTSMDCAEQRLRLLILHSSLDLISLLEAAWMHGRFRSWLVVARVPPGPRLLCTNAPRGAHICFPK